MKFLTKFYVIYIQKFSKSLKNEKKNLENRKAYFPRKIDESKIKYVC